MEAHGGHPLDPRILYVDLTADYSSLEDWGLHLFNTMAARFRAALFELEKNDPRPLRSSIAIPEGPHFVYETTPRLFHTRSGRGPLFIAWDTNILIDYFKYGQALWEGGSLPDFADGDYAGELEGLQMLIALWVLRDIRFVVLPASIKDAKKRLSSERQADRIRAFEEFTSALSLVSGEPSGTDPPSREGLLILPDSLLEDAVANLPQGFDRTLVRSAARMGIHVFMTMDKGILRQRAALKSFGLLLASPLDLLEELIACGAFHCMLAPRFAYWPMPDQMRVGHLIQALPAFD
ncbi:hypothetical protein OG589_08455 [Sphaerisporangium sp. NBC_01403]|uniref:hypothetical protein n=1 Tax=Sphaerisporangium sp. NBC_01403 TaxID=2903599 RepID=UPI00324EF91A